MRRAAWGAVGAAAVAAALAARPVGLDARALALFARGFFPPALGADFLQVVAVAALRTVAIAVSGTALSVVLGLPLGILATGSLSRRGPAVAGDRGRPLSAALSIAARCLLQFLRAVPDIVWALFFVVAFGLGPLPGALALGVSSAGMLGRVYADLFEAVPPGPVLAVHATGASRLQSFLAAIWPQARPSVVAYTLYSFECCVRAAAVLGLVGAGGIGAEINLSMRLFEYGQVTTLLAAFVLIVLGTDALSRALRGRFQRNALHGSGLLRDVPAAVRGRRAFPWGATLVAVVLSLWGAGFFTARAGELLPRVARFARQLVPPDMEGSFLASIAEPLWQTVAISIVGTAIGIVLGAVLALPATATVSLWRRGDADRPRPLLRLLARAAYASSRTLLALLRSIPELVWVLLCVIAVGLGAFAGALALGLHTAGVLGKLYAETLEEVPGGPVGELQAAGATRLQRLAWAALPQARETLASYTLLRWETNLRVSTVVGMVGGGGLGLALYNAVQLGWYPRAATLVAVIWLLVATTDALAYRLRRAPAAAPASALQLVSAASGTPAAL